MEARNKVIDAMERAIPVARDAENLPESAPLRHANTTIDLSRAGKLIGRAGENVKDIEATTGAKISIGGEQEAADGVVPVGVFAPNKAALEAALARVELVKYVLRAGDTVSRSRHGRQAVRLDRANGTGRRGHAPLVGV